MTPDEIDLSVYPAYLNVRASAEPQGPAEAPEAVVRGVAYAFVVGLLGVMLGVAVSRQTLVMVNIDTLVGAVTSGAMVLLYARGAKAAPRRGLVPLVVLLLFMLFVGYAALLAGRAWWVYSLLDEAIGMPMSRSSFVWSIFADHGFFSSHLLVPFLLSSVAGGCLALWKVRRRAEA